MVSVPALVMVTVPPPVVVTVLSMPTAPEAFRSTAPATVAVLSRSRVPALTTVSPPSAVTPPSAPVNVTLPVPAVTERPLAPSTVLLKVTLPAPAPLFRATAPVKVTAEAKLMPSLVVVTSPDVETPPAPSWVKAPSRLMSPAAAMVSVPALVMVTVPFVVVVTAPPMVNTWPLRSMPVLVEVASAPLKAVVPVPATWLMNLADTAAAVTLAALETVRPFSSVEPPRAPEKTASPVPAATVRVFAPSTAPLNVMSPAVAPVVTVVLAVRASALLNTTLAPAPWVELVLAPPSAVMADVVPATVMPPAPVRLMAPAFPPLAPAPVPVAAPPDDVKSSTERVPAVAARVIVPPWAPATPLPELAPPEVSTDPETLMFPVGLLAAALPPAVPVEAATPEVSTLPKLMSPMLAVRVPMVTAKLPPLVVTVAFDGMVKLAFPASRLLMSASSSLMVAVKSPPSNVTLLMEIERPA